RLDARAHRAARARGVHIANTTMGEFEPQLAIAHEREIAGTAARNEFLYEYRVGPLTQFVISTLKFMLITRVERTPRALGSTTTLLFLRTARLENDRIGKRGGLCTRFRSAGNGHAARDGDAKRLRKLGREAFVGGVHRILVRRHNQLRAGF